MDWNNFYNGNNNPNMNRNYGYQPLMRYEVIQVNGRAGAESFRMAPNSSTLLLDTTSSIIWFAQTDGAGYLTVTPYDFKPHEEVPPININDIDARLKKLEEYYVQQSNNAATKPSKKPRTNEQSSAD
jgi:hypothetical protein